MLMAAGGALALDRARLDRGAVAARFPASGAGPRGADGISDRLRGWIFTGLPWALSGHIWIDTPAAQLAAVLGAIGLSPD
ncbi:MAG: hypothetical protein U1E55_13965 [Paracoccus sp. (in: a-proteobacteria)]